MAIPPDPRKHKKPSNPVEKKEPADHFPDPAKKVEAPIDRRGAPPGQFGNPPHDPTEKTRAIVKGFIIAGTPHIQIAEYLEISHDTLTKHYKRELSLSLEELKHELAGVMVRRARNDEHKDCQRAAEYLMSRRGGDAWKEKSTHEHTGAGGGPIETRQLPATDDWIKQFAGAGAKTPPAEPSED